jgi:perosamine synthetase
MTSAAIADGPAVSELISLCVPRIQGHEWEYVKECLDTGWVSSVGAYVIRFEEAVARATGAKHAIATVNGTAALHVALLVSGVQPDEEVLVSTLTFIAPVNAIRYAGAWPVFIDAEPDYWQMDPNRVREFLEHHCQARNGGLYNRRTGRRVRAILPVHILGHPVDFDPLRDLAGKYGLRIIEDATEGFGASYRGTPVGRLGEIACLSFNGNKLITTGGGGMILTDVEELAVRARYLTTQAKDDPIEYIHNTIGYNYRLTNIQAALGVAQMELMDDFVGAKRRIAAMYDQRFLTVPGLRSLGQAPWAKSVYWMYTVLVDSARFGCDARALMGLLAASNIQTRPLWQPIHLSRAHHQGYTVGGEVAEHLYRSALSLPCSVGLTVDHQDRVIEQVRAAAGL